MQPRFPLSNVFPEPRAVPGAQLHLRKYLSNKQTATKISNAALMTLTFQVIINTVASSGVRCEFKSLGVLGNSIWPLSESSVGWVPTFGENKQITKNHSSCRNMDFSFCLFFPLICFEVPNVLL